MPAIGPGAPQMVHGRVPAEAVLISAGISKRPTASNVRASIVMSSPATDTNLLDGKIVIVEIGAVNWGCVQKRIVLGSKTPPMR